MITVPHVSFDEMAALMDSGRVAALRRDIIEIDEDGYVRRHVHPTNPQKGFDADGNLVATTPAPSGHERVVEKIITLGLRERLFRLVPADPFQR